MSKKQNIDIPLNQCAFYKCASKKRLAKILRVSLNELKNLGGIEAYNVFRQPKNKAGFRTIYAPSEKLKAIQRRVKVLLQRIEKPEWVFSGKMGSCHIDNGAYHKDSRYLIAADIANFYDSCTREQVYSFFKFKMRTAPDVAEILTSISTLTLEDGTTLIPSGSPCSQLVSYFAYSDMFEELQGLANRYGCKLSIYVDDITISSNNPISNPRNVEKQVNKILHAYGHKIKWRKTKYYGSNTFRVITGVALKGNGDMLIPNNLGEKIIINMHDVLEGDDLKYPTVIGQIGAARQIKPYVFPEVERVIQASISEE